MLQEGSYTPEKQRVNGNENSSSPGVHKECHKPNSKQLEKERNLILKDARSFY